MPVKGLWPRWIQEERVLPQPLGDAQALYRSEARHTLAPVLILGVARRLPIAGHELPNAACQHSLSLAH